MWKWPKSNTISWREIPHSSLFLSSLSQLWTLMTLTRADASPFITAGISSDQRPDLRPIRTLSIWCCTPRYEKANKVLAMGPRPRVRAGRACLRFLTAWHAVEMELWEVLSWARSLTSRFTVHFFTRKFVMFQIQALIHTWARCNGFIHTLH